MNTAPVVTHTIQVSADADTVFARLLDVSGWADMFEPTIHACELSHHEGVQTIQLWATANGEPKTWVSERQVDVKARTICFQQSVCATPVAEMSGTWRVVAGPDDTCTVELDHSYRAEGDDPSSLAWIAAAVEANSTKELAALKATCEADDDSSPFTFSDAIETDADPQRVFAFLDEGGRWADRLDHVADATMTEYPGGLQRLRMSTRTPDHDTHVTESYRVSQSPAVLRYKQSTLPALLSLHTGRWTITPAGEKWRVTSTHTVAIKCEAITDVLGVDYTPREARDLARANLGNNSRRTLEAAVAWANSGES